MLEVDDEYISNWIEVISHQHNELNGLSICPFAKSFDHKIIKTSIHDIKPLDSEYGVVIFIIEDDLDPSFIQKKCIELSKKYPKYTFFEDSKNISNFIGEIETNNQKYNLILYQNRELLSKLRQKLAKTKYYDFWDEKYLRKILGSDYEIVKNIRNK